MPEPRCSPLASLWAVALAVVLVAVAATPAGAQASSTTARPPSTTRAPSTTAAPTTAPVTSAAPTTAGTAAVGTAAGSAPVVGSDAEEPAVESAPQPFPAQLVAPVSALEAPVERSVTDLYVPPTTTPDRPDVVVQFRSPFTLPERPFRVSVLAGDRHGTRLRASLRSQGVTGSDGRPQLAGVVERGQGASWQPVGDGTTPVAFVPSGLAVIGLPLADVPPGGAVWAEVETGTDGRTVTTTPTFALDTVLGRATGGLLPGTPFGQVAGPDAVPTDEVVDLPAPPTLSVANQVLRLSSTERPPTSVAGQPVVGVVDYVRIAPNYNRRAVITHFIRVDRTTGTVTLNDGYAVPPHDQSSQPGWLVDGLTRSSSLEPTTVSFDLPAVAAALGIELGPTTTAFGIRRQIDLADGRVVVADAVMGTLSWLDPTFVAPAPEGATGAAAADGTAADGPPVVLIGLAVLAVVVVLIAGGLVIRRRQRRGDVVDDDAADQLDLLAAELAARRRTDRRGTGPGAPTDEVPEVPEVAPRRAAPAAVDAEAAEVSAGPEVVGDGAEGTPAAERPTDARVDDALGALEDDFADLTARFERLGGDDDAGA